MISKSTKLVEDIFSLIKSCGGDFKAQGKIIGSRTASIGSPILSYNSYNQSLKSQDFENLVRNQQLGIKSSIDNEKLFELLTVRDSRYFTFRDRYLLRFKDDISMRRYVKQTLNTSLDDQKIRFEQNLSKKVVSDILCYQRNIKAAYKSKKDYIGSLKGMTEDRNDDHSLLKHLDIKEIHDIEAKSLLVWDLPLNYKAQNIKLEYWWYDIMHSFRLWCDESRGSTLTYVSFHDIEQAMKFHLNVHGLTFKGCQLKVEQL